MTISILTSEILVHENLILRLLLLCYAHSFPGFAYRRTTRSLTSMWLTIGGG